MEHQGFSPVMKRPKGEVDQSPPSTAKVNAVWSIASMSVYACMAWCLGKRDYYKIISFEWSLTMAGSDHNVWRLFSNKQGWITVRHRAR